MFAKIWTTKLWPKGQTKRGAAVSGMMLLTIIIAFAVIVPLEMERHRTHQRSGRYLPVRDHCLCYRSRRCIRMQAPSVQRLRAAPYDLARGSPQNHQRQLRTYRCDRNSAQQPRVNIELEGRFPSPAGFSPFRQVESLYAEVFAEEEHTHVQWPILSQVQRDWGKGDLIVEPGESHQESYDFIVSTDVESVSLYTYFYNPGYPRALTPPRDGEPPQCMIYSI